MEAAWIGVHMWKQAVEKAKSTDADKVIARMAGQTSRRPRASLPRWIRRTPPAQGGVHRRGQGRRPVQHRLADEGTDQGAAVEPLHCCGNDTKKDEPDGKTIITK